MKKSILFISLFALFLGCNKEKTELFPDQYFIADINNSKTTFKNVIQAEYFYQIDSLGNYLIDQLSMVINSDDKKVGIELHISNSEFKNINFPDNLNSNDTLLITLCYRQYNTPADTVYSITDDWNYMGQIDNLLLTMYDSDKYLSGQLSGNINTKTGRTLYIQNASFRIKLNEIETDVKPEN